MNVPAGQQDARVAFVSPKAGAKPAKNFRDCCNVNIRSTKSALYCATVLSLAWLAPAMAQEAQPTEPADPATEEESIVVTGSRIRSPEFSQPNPVQVLSAAAIQASGQTNLTEFLSDNPALLGSARAIDNAGSNLPSAQAVGSNFLNLRNLGQDRTLVLVDGAAMWRAFPALPRWTSTRFRPTLSSA